jgi:hypothetical protein
LQCGQILPVFVKILEIVRKESNGNVRYSPNLKEIELFKTTNKLLEKQILNSFVYCYNPFVLDKNWTTYKKTSYSVLLTEPLGKDFIEIYKYIYNHKIIPKCILFEIVYTLHTLNLIGMKHMDLHGGNVFIKKLPKNEFHVRRYDAVVNGEIMSFFVPTTHTIKIIDLDSGHKEKSNIATTNFKEKINNPHKFTGRVHTDPRSNMLKIAHTFMTSSKHPANMRNQLWQLGIRGETDVPFFPNENSLHSTTKQYYDKMYFANHGILINIKKQNLKFKFLKIDDSMIWAPIKSLMNMHMKNMFPPVPYHVVYSQESIIKKKHLK